MATRPLYNGAARVGVDNNQVDAALHNRYVFRAQVGVAPVATTETIVNQGFDVEAGQSCTIHYDIRKYGSGLAQSAPDDALIRIFNDDDSNDARTGAVAEFDVLPIATALPVVGSVTFTPATAGTFRIQVELQRGGGNFIATQTDWRVISDGFYANGGTSTIVRANYQDKGRLRAGTRLNSVAITDRGNPAPATFAYTGTEAVRIETTTAHGANKTTSTESFRIRQRRTGTTTIDHDSASVPQSPTIQRVEHIVNESWPVAAVTFDTVAAVTNTSALHANNTRQYDALGGQAASGLWVHLLGAGAGLSFVNYFTVEAFSTHTVDPRAAVLHHMQINNSAVGTPPTINNDVDDRRAVTEIGFLGFRIINARSEGVNGVTATEQIRDSANLADPYPNRSVTTATAGGQAGWTPALMSWRDTLPTENWNHVVSLTGGASVLATNGTKTYVLGAPMLDDLSDVDTAGVQTGNALVFSGTGWTPGQGSGGGSGLVGVVA